MGIRGFFGNKRKLLKLSGLVVVVLAVVGTYVAFGPPGLYAKSETPEFCAQCHVMEAQYENWFHQGGHRRLKCNDCHLPNDNLARHITWKGYEGMWDVFVFNSGRVPETIQISESGAAIVQENCRRCHAETIARINEDRNCWLCHRRLSHKNSGAM
jgi:cytochrome c nitrite reductase small subunit